VERAISEFVVSSTFGCHCSKNYCTASRRLVWRQSSIDECGGILFLEDHAEGCPSDQESAMEKYRITLTTEERVELERLVSRGRGAARKFCHARILLLADETPGLRRPDEDIVAALRTSRRTVERVPVASLPRVGGRSAPRSQPARPGRSKSRGRSSKNSSSWRAAIPLGTLPLDVADAR